MPTIRQVYFESLPKVKKSKNISTPLLKDLLIKVNGFSDELELTTRFDDEMKNQKRFEKMLSSIIKGKMYEYVVNEACFDGKKFFVDKNVLIPRQETEELLCKFVEIINKKYEDKNRISIADVCTGSGILGISISSRYPCAKVYASDIDKNALRIARKNNKNLGTNVKFFEGNLLKPFIEKKVKLDCIISNPPYIENEGTIDKRTWAQEPHVALLAKPCTKYYEEILKDAKNVLKENSIMAFEIGEDMKTKLKPIVKKYFPDAKVDFIKDMDGKDRMMTLVNQKKYKNAAEALLDHGVISFPTETVMGLGIIYDDKVAFKKLNEVKRRPENKPYSLMLSDVKDIEKYAHMSAKERKVAEAFLPGPITLLLKKKKLPMWVTLESPFVGIRIPDMNEIRNVIRKAGKPILAPSANRSGESPALTNKEVLEIFGNEIDFNVSGDALNGMPSTIVKIDDDVKIIREGPISRDQIMEVLK